MGNATKKATQQEAQRKNEQEAAEKGAPQESGQSGAQAGNTGAKQKPGAVEGQPTEPTAGADDN